MAGFFDTSPGTLYEALLGGFAAAEEEEQVFYISFATDDAFLGGCYIVAASEADALLKATEIGCNPGGEALILGPIPRSAIKADFLGRLMTDKAEIEKAEA